jgi:hypothetical protein
METMNYESFTDTNFYSLVDRKAGIAALYADSGREIVSITTTERDGLFYGAVFHKQKDE